MENQRREIEKNLSKVPAKDLQEYLKSFIEVFWPNPDFYYTKAIYRREEGREYMDEVPADRLLEKCIDREDVELLYDLVMVYGGKIKKAEAVKSLADIFMNDALLEAISFAYFDERDRLMMIAKSMGVMSVFMHIWTDPVYRKREKYLKKVRQAASAAVNLYGVISVHDTYELFKCYEADLLADKDGYERTNGKYRKTICFKPCEDEKGFEDTLVFLQRANEQYFYGVSMDHMLVHPFFYDDVVEETMFFSDEALDDDDEPKIWTHRLLIENIYEKNQVLTQRYLPDKDDFYKYCDVQYNELFNLAEHNLVSYLKYECDAENELLDVRDCDIVASVKAVLAVWRGGDELHNFFDVYDTLSDILGKFGIEPYSKMMFMEILGQILNVYKTSRLWNFKGHTKKEVKGSAFKKVYQERLIELYELDQKSYDDDLWDDDDDDELFPDSRDLNEEQILDFLSDFVDYMKSLDHNVRNTLELTPGRYVNKNIRRDNFSRFNYDVSDSDE